MNKLLSNQYDRIICLLLVGWVFSIPGWAWACRWLLVVAVLLWAANWRRLSDFYEPGNFPRFLIFFPVVWFVLLLVYQIVQTLWGAQGIDFAVFTQAIASVAKDWSLDTFLITEPNEGKVSFLTHHFSPILYIPGIMAWFGVPATFAGIICQFLSVGLGLLFFYKFLKAPGIESSVAVLFVVLLCLHPYMRIGLGWEVHDEIFGFGCIGLSYWAWYRRNDVVAVAALLGCMLCKETMFLYAIFFSLMVLIMELRNGRDASRRRLLIYLIPFLLGLFGTYFYTLCPPEFLHKTFFPSSRIASLSQAFLMPVLIAKLVFFVKLFLPFCFLPLLTMEGLILSLPAIAFLGPIAVTNFEFMYNPGNYYGVLPTLILAFASVVSLKCLAQRTLNKIPKLVYVTVLLFSLSQAREHRPFAYIIRSLSQPRLSSQQLSYIPANARVITDDYNAQFLMDKEKVIREAKLTEYYNRPLNWSHALIRKSKPWVIPPIIIQNSHLCFESDIWKVFCRDQGSGKIF